MKYFLPPWWNWIEEDWSRCQACLQYNGTPCISCEVPPGLLAMVCLNGGGTATVAGNMRGNCGIHSKRQAKAAARVSSASQVNVQLKKQQLKKNIKSTNVNRY